MRESLRSLRGWTLGLLALLLLAACGGGDPTATPPPPTTRPESSTPGARRVVGGGGEFIMALSIEQPMLDPARANNVTASLATRQIYSGLVRLNNQLEAEPDLAERWDISEDQRTYTFHLREGASFADGRAITAEDVLWSLERAIDPALASSPPAATYLNDIDGALEKLAGAADSVRGLRVVDQRTVEVTLREPSSVFLLKFTHPPAAVVDRRTVERYEQDAWGRRSNASGSFRIHQLSDEALVLRPNLGYAGRPPRLDQLTMLLGASAFNELLLYEQGDVDYAEVSGFDLGRVSDPSNPLARELLRVPELSLSYIAMNVTLPPFDDPKVRQAFSLLFDRLQLVKADSITTTVAVAARGYVPPTMPGANQELPELPQAQVERARQLLAESRYGGSQGLPPIVGYGGVGLLAELLQQSLGITMEVRSASTFSEYLEGIESFRYPIFALSWIADYPDPENFLEVLFGAQSGSNYTKYNNPEVEQLFAQARAEEDPRRRYALYQQAERLILADMPAIPLSHGITHALVKPYVRGLEVTPMGLVDLSTVELVR